jgi:hypothetical protein
MTKLAAAAPSPDYYVTLKVSGSSNEKIFGAQCCSLNETSHASFTYSQRFGPVNPFQTTAHVPAPAAGESGSGAWSGQVAPPEASTCHEAGTFSVLGPGQMSVVEAHGPGFDGGLLRLSGGQSPFTQSAFNGCRPDQDFVAAAIPQGHNVYICGAIRNAFVQPAKAQCNIKATFFTVELSVSEAGLKQHHMTYSVSDAQANGEKVDKYCNQPPPWSPGYSVACKYNWSGTVTFAPAG